MVAVLNNKFDRAVKFSLTKCAYTHSFSKNQLICCCVFFGNIKFNGAVSLNIISQQTLKQYPSSSTRQMFLLYNFQILYLNTKRKFKKSYKINEIFTS